MSDELFHEIHHMDVRLSYADCDPAQILYYAAWFPWMERVQSEWLYLNDLRADTLAERFGFATITRRAECDYLSPARLFELIRVSMTVARLGNTSIRFGFRMVRQDDQVLVARGALILVTIDEHGQPVTVPDRLRTVLQATALPPAPA